MQPPRLVFFGRYLTDPSTINNVPQHFDLDHFTPNLLQPGDNVNGWWNPKGSATWQFIDTRVTAAVYRDGSTCLADRDGAATDPAMTLRMVDANDRVSGKLVDLDPQQQMVSQLWGLRVRFEAPGSHLGFGGTLRVTAFNDLFARYPQGHPDSMFSAVFQTTVEDVWWGDNSASRALTELQAAFDAAGDGAALSLRIVTDAFDDDADSPWFTTGRLSGAIGVATADEPRRFVRGRRFDPPPGASSNSGAGYGGGVALLCPADGDRPATLHVDLGNSLQTVSPGGDWVDDGVVAIALKPSGAPSAMVLGAVPYRQQDWYETTSGIVALPLSASLAALAATSPVQVLGRDATTAVLAEADDGMWVRADQFVFRMSAGDQTTVELAASRFGVPATGITIGAGLDSSSVQGPPSAGPPAGVPTSALTVTPSVTTDHHGRAELVLTASDPGNPRGYIDGQVYGVTFAPGSSPPPRGSVNDPAKMLNVLVWSGVDVPAEPTWIADIEPIFNQYALLYPVMKPIVDLADYADVVRRRTLLIDAFSKPLDDPGYMPVTRDLSPAKRDMIVRWLETCRYMSIRSVDDLAQALQRAVELEHSTIPPYLCALYSIKPGRNVEIAATLRAVVVEEMLHLTLVANLLASIGRGADLGRPGIVPIYPCPLPGGLIAGLTVHLRALSIEQVRDCFMAIERGHRVVEPVHGRVAPGNPVEVTACTIDWFYDEIEAGMVALHRAGELTFGHADRQVTRWPSPGALAPIDSLQSAQAALATIRRQGEGSGSLHPFDGGPDRELAHYFRFAEIVEGRRLVPDEAGGWSYSGEVVPFDPAGVYPMADDPDGYLLTPGTRAAVLAQRFRRSYRSLLRALHTAFNGQPDTIGSAMSLMYAVDIGARQMMEVPLPDDPTHTVGPTF